MRKMQKMQKMRKMRKNGRDRGLGSVVRVSVEKAADMVVARVVSRRSGG